MDELYAKHENLVEFVIKKFWIAPGVDKEDLLQAGRLALLRALRNYSANKAEFSTFATACIYHAMVKETAKAFYFNKCVRTHWRMLSAHRCCQQTTPDRQVTEEDLIRHLGVEHDEYLKLKCIQNGTTPLYWYDLSNNADPDVGSQTVGDMIADSTDIAEAVIFSVCMEKAKASLPENYRGIVDLFLSGYTAKEIREATGVSWFISIRIKHKLAVAVLSEDGLAESLRKVAHGKTYGSRFLPKSIHAAITAR